MEKFAISTAIFQVNKTPVPQANRSPVPQANRSPVPQANRSPVGQATRNPIRNPLETHTETQGVCENLNDDKKTLAQKSGLTIAQIHFILAKQQTSIEELAKAVKILRKSRQKQNIMKLLSTVAFFEGQCILAPDEADEAERLQTRVNARLRQEGQRLEAERVTFEQRLESRRNAALENLKWYQDSLTDAQRSQVRAHIIAKHPSTQARFRSGDFGPAILAFLGVARQTLGL